MVLLRRLQTICLLIVTFDTYFMLRVSAKTFSWREWWKHTVIYQIYPFSFMDSNSDGFGDLNGIRSRLDYLVDIGINTIWITPIYESPMKDFGYDVSNYTKVDPLFGTMAHFDALIQEMHEKGIRLLMDFVPNHTSNKHKWFLESRKSNDTSNAYRDYYVWKDPKEGCQDPDMNSSSHTCVPNNWVSHFGGSSWTWAPERQQYYYHHYLKDQPDLNYSNPVVREEMKDILRFWLERGVDGFRVDGIRHLYEDGSLADEPVDPKFISPPNMTKPLYAGFLHPYTADLAGVHTVVKSWRSEVFEKYSTPPNYRFMGTQGYGNAETLSLYYGSKEEPEADFPFNFQMIELTQQTLSGIEIHRLIDDWLTNIPDGAWSNWVFSHHGKNRITNRFGAANQRVGLLLSLLLPGTPNVYYGEEIGMSNIDIKFEDQLDAWGKNNPCCWKRLNRDQHRSPMQWNTTQHAGFSTSNKTWLPVHDDYLRGINVQDQLNDHSSSLSLFKMLMRLRKTSPALETNNITYGVVNEDIFSFLRIPDEEDAGNTSYLVVINFSNRTIHADFTTSVQNKSLVFENNDGVQAMSSKMDQDERNVNLKDVVIEAHEALVIRVSVNLHTNEKERYLFLISVFMPVVFYVIMSKMETRNFKAK